MQPQQENIPIQPNLDVQPNISAKHMGIEAEDFDQTLAMQRLFNVEGGDQLEEAVAVQVGETRNNDGECSSSDENNHNEDDEPAGFDVSTDLPGDQQLLRVIAQSMPPEDRSLDVLIEHEPPHEVFKSLAGRSWLVFSFLLILPKDQELHFTLARLAIDLVRQDQVVQTFVTQGWPLPQDQRIKFVDLGRQGPKASPVAQVNAMVGPYKVGSPLRILVTMQCDRDSSIPRKMNIFHAVVRLRDPIRHNQAHLTATDSLESAQQAAELLERADAQGRAALEAPARVENCARTRAFKILSKFNHQFVKGGGDRRKDVIKDHDKRYSDQRKLAVENFGITGNYYPPFTPVDLKAFVLAQEKQENPFSGGLADDQGDPLRSLAREPSHSMDSSPQFNRGVKRPHTSMGDGLHDVSSRGIPMLGSKALSRSSSSMSDDVSLSPNDHLSRAVMGVDRSGDRHSRRGSMKQADRRRQNELEDQALAAWNSLNDQGKLSVFFQICPDLARLSSLMGTFSPLGGPLPGMMSMQPVVPLGISTMNNGDSHGPLSGRRPSSASSQTQQDIGSFDWNPPLSGRQSNLSEASPLMDKLTTSRPTSASSTFAPRRDV